MQQQFTYKYMVSYLHRTNQAIPTYLENKKNTIKILGTV